MRNIIFVLCILQCKYAAMTMDLNVLESNTTLHIRLLYLPIATLNTSFQSEW